MKNTSKKAATLLAFSFSFTLIAGCAKNSSSSAPDASVSDETTDTDSFGEIFSPDSSSSNDSNGEQPDSSVPDSTTPVPPDDNVAKPEPKPSPEPVKNYASYIRCTGNNVNLRSGAGTGYAIVGSAEKDTVYAVAGKTGDWYKTYYQNQTVYINSSYTSVFSIEKSDNPVIEDVIREGYKQLGVPYVYGAVRLHDGYGNFLKGFTKMKFDCSSLVQYVFFEGANVLLQTTTRLQVVQGDYVSRSQLSRGDCIYFTNSARANYTGVERVGHVAIYLGDNYILHTSSDYARIEKMNSQRRAYYIEARRFV